MKHIISALTGLLLILAITPAVLKAADESEKTTPPPLAIEVRGTPRQGGFLYVTVRGTEKDDSGECTWRGKTYPLVWLKGSLGAIIPVALDLPKGAYRVKMTVKRSDGSDASIDRTIACTPYTYGVQHIWLSESQLSKYDDPQADRDNDDIRKALAVFTPGIMWDRSFIWPVRAHISTLFGLKRFYNDDKVPEFHRGVDLPAGTGTPIKASQRGIVRFAKRNLLLHGTTAVIDHGRGIGTLYLHMSSLKVKTGDRVEQGDIIGAVGSTGAGTGPHLHWAAYAQGEPIDPKLLFNIPAEWLGK